MATSDHQPVFFRHPLPNQIILPEQNPLIAPTIRRQCKHHPRYLIAAFYLTDEHRLRDFTKTFLYEHNVENWYKTCAIILHSCTPFLSHSILTQRKAPNHPKATVCHHITSHQIPNRNSQTVKQSNSQSNNQIKPIEKKKEKKMSKSPTPTYPPSQRTHAPDSLPAPQ